MPRLRMSESLCLLPLYTIMVCTRKFLLLLIHNLLLLLLLLLKLQTYTKINGDIRRHFGKQMNKETKLSIHNITAKTALKFGSEAWVLKKRKEQRLEAAQMKFLRHLLRITKLDKEKNQCIRGKNGSTEHSKGNKRVPEKVATTRTEDGHKWNTKTNTTI